MELPTEFPEGATQGMVLGPAMMITAQEDADAYFETIVKHAMRMDPDVPRETVERNVRRSLGYFAGYHDEETRERVEHLFDCAHPVFGKVSEGGVPTAEEAVRLGVEAAEKKG